MSALTRRLVVAICIVVPGLLAGCASVQPAGSEVVMEEFMIPSTTPGIQLYVRNKQPRGISKFPGDKILLFVHGSTYPAETAFDLKLGAYRVVSRDAARNRWLTGVSEHKKQDLIPAGWFEAWAEATFATDPAGGGTKLRAPNGTIQDTREYWAAGKPLYDPGEIRVPTFLAHAEWDQDLPSYMLHAYFAKLTNVPYKAYIEIGEGTHTVMMEKNRMQLFSAVQRFLDETHVPGR